MPYKDYDEKLAAQRRWYAIPENRERTIAKVAERKRKAYGGICKNCGGPTTGESKNHIREWCGKPECRSAQMKARQT